MIFTKSAFANKAAKSIDFRVVLQPKIHQRSSWFCTCKRYRNFPAIFMEFHKFPLHFDLQDTPPNHLKIDSGSFWRQSGIDLVLQGRIWMDSERLGLEFSLIWARFWLYFRMNRAWRRGFCKRSLDEQYALVAALIMALLLSHCIFSLTSGAAGCASRLRRPRRVHGVLDPNNNSAQKSILQKDIYIYIYIL